MNSIEKISVLIADDHQLIRDCWKFILEADGRFHIVGSVDNGDEAVQLAVSVKPDIVLMDINLKGMRGFEATKHIKKMSPGTKILGVSVHALPPYVKKMMQCGASGYVTKNSGKEELIDAIIQIYHGNSYVCEEVRNNIIESEIDVQPKTDINVLSKRELEVIEFLKEGKSSKQISVELNLSAKTVEVHRYNILRKLDLPNTAALVNFVNYNAV